MTAVTAGLGRILSFDDRNTNFDLRRVVKMPPLVAQRNWALSPSEKTGLNIHESGIAPAGAWVNWLDTQHSINGQKQVPVSPDYIFEQAQHFDGIELPHAGTTILACAKVLKKLGMLDEYYWGTDYQTIHTYLVNYGPLVIGTDWYEGMFYPDAEGFVIPEGPYIDGAAYLCLGYSAVDYCYTFLQNWGRKWGQKGMFKMREGDFAVLMNQGGEACAGVHNGYIAKEV